MSRRAKSARRGASGAVAVNDRKKNRDIFVARPFEGLADEPQWIALRELVPAASAPLRLAGEYAERYPDRPVTLATILPMAVGAVAKADGQVLLGLQRHQQSGDVSRDLAASLLAALRTPPGETVETPALPGAGPRLQDVLEPLPLDVTVHSGLDFWLDTDPAEDSDVRASLDRANASIYPTAALAAAPAGYWCRPPERAHVRWVLGEDEDLALRALARLASAGELTWGDGTRFAGMFRAHGRLVPVWDVPPEAGPEAWEAPAARFAERYAAALAVPDALSVAERRARQGLLGRQIPLR
ncbi:MAG: topoisomerase II [Dactylosporangium sp.]|nr:topoisomerase II [Dactylosporangium sp.]NNJ59637.1 topoisomerase II [Dactylosporangium sp.]